MGVVYDKRDMFCERIAITLSQKDDVTRVQVLRTLDVPARFLVETKLKKLKRKKRG